MHTPGPWVVGKAFKSLGNNPTFPIDSVGSTCGECGRGKGDSYVVAHTFKNAVPAGQHKANADLIAAAPDMLAVVQEMAEYMGEPMTPTPGNLQAAVVNALIRNIRAALAKAEGRAP